MNKFLSIILFLALLTGCGKYPADVHDALKQSGDNRPELEKVLEHYSESPSDSLKLRAAEFLIGNMPGHYTLGGEQMEEYRRRIYADTTTSYQEKKEVEIVISLLDQVQSGGSRLEDVQSLSAAFLIRHIDASFEMLERYAWLKDITFDFFLEYLLPYRVAYEKPDLWRDSLQVIQKQWNQKLFIEDNLNSFMSLNSFLRLTKDGILNCDILLGKLTQTSTTGDCRLACYCDLFSSRVKGLPLIMDYTPHYSNRNGYHYWLADPPMGMKKYEMRGAFDRRTAKIYRYTYSLQPVIQPVKGEYIPSFFLDPFHKDVTDLYYHTVDIQVLVKKPVNQQYHPYLAVFNNLDWKPVVAGQFKGNHAFFEKMSTNIVYLPIAFRKEIPESFNYPFILELNQSLRYLVPDTTVLQKMSLFRKNPASSHILGFCNNIQKTVIAASNDPNFRKVDTVFVLNTAPEQYYRSMEQQSPQSYKYYRITYPYIEGYFAEWKFYDETGKQISGQVDPRYANSFDDNVLTYSTLLGSDECVIRFDTPVAIKKMVCLPRSDGNGVYPGNVYQLLYYGPDGWCSLGEKEATDYHMDYDNVPSGALYWLRNLSSGVEERVFTWEDGRPRFW